MISRSIFSWPFQWKSNMILSNQVEAEEKSVTSGVQENPQPTFGPHPNMGLNYNFEDGVKQLPFKFNLGDAPFNKGQQD